MVCQTLAFLKNLMETHFYAGSKSFCKKVRYWFQKYSFDSTEAIRANLM